MNSGTRWTVKVAASGNPHETLMGVSWGFPSSAFTNYYLERKPPENPQETTMGVTWGFPDAATLTVHQL